MYAYNSQHLKTPPHHHFPHKNNSNHYFFAKHTKYQQAADSFISFLLFLLIIIIVNGGFSTPIIALCSIPLLNLPLLKLADQTHTFHHVRSTCNSLFLSRLIFSTSIVRLSFQITITFFLFLPPFF